MTIIDFYKQLSRILTDCREKFITKEKAAEKLEILLVNAKKHSLEINISDSILEDEVLIKLDDENSFVEPEEWEDDSSFESSY